MHILILEDDLGVGAGLQTALKADGISSAWFRRVADLPQLRAKPSPEHASFDAALLDVALPDGSGLDVLRGWRRAGIALPTLMLTARGGLQDRLQGLDGGADDYIVKPFAAEELIARLHAVLRRSASQASDAWVFGDLELQARGHVVRVQGALVALSPREFDLLEVLARSAGSVVPKDVLARRLVPLGEPLDFGALEVHVFNLRKKIGTERISTLRGVGYRLCP